MGEWQRMRIVIADTQDLAEAIASRLKKLGYAVDFVGDGGEAELCCRTVRPTISLYLTLRCRIWTARPCCRQGSRTLVLVLTTRSRRQ